MTEMGKIKRRPSTLGAPPPLNEASQNLKAPEIAPPAPVSTETTGRIDGRTLRRTERTIQFATRVTLEFDTQLRRIAQRQRLKLVEVLEKALDLYETRS